MVNFVEKVVLSKIVWYVAKFTPTCNFPECIILSLGVS